MVSGESVHETQIFFIPARFIQSPHRPYLVDLQCLRQAALFSRKIDAKWLRLQFVLGYNWAKNKTTLDYRITTKWSDGPRLKRKERVSERHSGIHP